MASTKIIHVQKNDSFDEVFDLFKVAQAQEVIFIFPRGTMFGRDDGYFKAIKDEADQSGKLVSVMTTDPIVAKLTASYGFSLLEAPSRKPRTISHPAGIPPPAQMPARLSPEHLVEEPQRTTPFEAYAQAASAEAQEQHAAIEEEIASPSTVIDIGSVRSDEEAADISIRLDEDSPIAELAAVRRGVKPKARSVPAPIASSNTTRKLRDIFFQRDEQDVVVEGSAEQDVSIPVRTGKGRPVIIVPGEEPAEELSKPSMQDDQPEESDEKRSEEPVLKPLHELSSHESEQVTATRPAPAMQNPPSKEPEMPRNSPLRTDIEKLWAEEAARRGVESSEDSSQQNVGKKIKVSRSFLKIAGIIVAVLIVVAGALAYASVGTAKVVVHPRTKDLNIILKITASSDIAKTDVDHNKIPGQRFAIQKEVKGSYPTSTEKEVALKAHGTITISNSEKDTQKLVATTRFESDAGKIFRIIQEVIVPSATTVNGATVPGKVTVVVYADAPGQDYNIAASSFTLPGLKGTPRFSTITAKSAAAMIGGVVGKAKVVSEQDILHATESLKKDLHNQLVTDAKQQIGSLAMVASPSVVFDPISLNAQMGEATDALQATLKGTMTIIAFQPTDVRAVIDQYVKNNSNMGVIQDGLVVTYVNGTLDKDGKTTSFDTKVSGHAAVALDKDAILKNIQGMSEAQIRDFFQKNADVESARILLSPFWIRSIPKDPKKITLELTTN
ncbi:MAG: hypothetical protein A3A33_00485 [Candidatus Yanofskybacteria bacterium RIFCSPLOWO2_01_FULL_49_25]|uniref:Baseplate protein J-like domain-containing protein n=1 Tax=Candidatus Yanofskybacteria bacterium RIFCSPLOWO2_01_FULL_49_25 TaxID=1802701 RepID=A0A1F8GT23_9BACT|nr:MAG: hypothetical protein A3A33_00485 [Candidatus Yanofskybacteria bacterium RIFCSPLOWO2_01_FULL_49_25]